MKLVSFQVEDRVKTHVRSQVGDTIWVMVEFPTQWRIDTQVWQQWRVVSQIWWHVEVQFWWHDDVRFWHRIMNLVKRHIKWRVEEEAS